MNVEHFLLKALNLRASHLMAFTKTAPHRYKVYSIPKRNESGTRVIAHPAKELKAIQRLLVDQYLNFLPVHECATAYVKGKNIKQNAQRHVDNKFLLKMDIRGFFPSIKPKHLITVVENVLNESLSENEKLYLKLIFFWFNRKTESLELSIGAPSSPFISNAIMYGFDTEMKNFCEAIDVVYTRYADDMAFSTSTPEILHNVEVKVIELINQIFGGEFSINSEKTVRVSTKNNRHITGITLPNQGGVSVGHSRKRFIRSQVYKFKTGQLEPRSIQQLKGLIAFTEDIEPGFVEKLKNKYGGSTIERLNDFRCD